MIAARPKASIRTSRRAAEYEQTYSPDSIFAAVVREARGLADAAALDAEQYASTIYGATTPLLEREPEARGAFHAELTAYLRRRPTSASEMLVRQGVKAPAWADAA